jgi:hypothetical protein
MFGGLADAALPLGCNGVTLLLRTKVLVNAAFKGAPNSMLAALRRDWA